VGMSLRSCATSLMHMRTTPRPLGRHPSRSRRAVTGRTMRRRRHRHPGRYEALYREKATEILRRTYRMARPSLGPRRPQPRQGSFGLIRTARGGFRGVPVCPVEWGELLEMTRRPSTTFVSLASIRTRHKRGRMLIIHCRHDTLVGDRHSAGLRAGRRPDPRHVPFTNWRLVPQRPRRRFVALHAAGLAAGTGSRAD
jgi:hypothetical protein